MATLFLGREKMTVDAKKRVPMPARFLSVLKAIDPVNYRKLGVIVSDDHSLMIMTRPVFEMMIAEWDSLDHNEEAQRIRKTLNYASAEEVELDGSNRLKLTDMVIEDCGIKRGVVFSGGKDFIQMWDEGTFQAFRAKNREKAEAPAQPATPQPIYQYVITPPVPGAVAPGAGVAPVPATIPVPLVMAPVAAAAPAMPLADGLAPANGPAMMP